MKKRVSGTLREDWKLLILALLLAILIEILVRANGG